MRLHPLDDNLPIGVAVAPSTATIETRKLPACSTAITQGKIADILQARGQLDEALRIRMEEQLPVYARLGDVRGRSVCLSKIAALRIADGGMNDSRLTVISGELSESLAIAKDLKLSDGIGYVGLQLAQVLAKVGKHEEASDVIIEAEKGAWTTGRK